MRSRWAHLLDSLNYTACPTTPSDGPRHVRPSPISIFRHPLTDLGQLRSDHPNTVISISDLLPAYAIEGDPNRMYPLEDDRHILQQGVRELALLRKVQGEKMKAEVAKGKEKGDVDYADGGQDSGDTGHQ